MTLKVNNNFIKESSTMEERNEAVGLKVKDVSIKGEDSIVTPEEVGDDTPIEETKFEEIPEEFLETESTPEVEVEPEIEQPTVEPTKDEGYKMISCARLFNYAGTTVFRFDIFYKEYAENSGIIELRNIVDNFSAVRPTKTNELKEFFAMFGIIRWNFPTTVMPVNTNIFEALLKIECLVNEQIKSAGIKKGRYEFRVDNVD